MSSAAGRVGGPPGGASAPSASFTSLERTLDKTIDCLVGGPQTREARALLIEARRLRSVVANWRSIPPPNDVRDEMLDRVVQLSTAVGAAFPESMRAIAAAATQGPEAAGPADEETEGYALDFEPQLYSLEAATLTMAAVRDQPAPAPLPGPTEGSEEEPTIALRNSSLRPPPDLLPAEPGPTPWPVDELPPAVGPAQPRPQQRSSPDLALPRPQAFSSPELPRPPALSAPELPQPRPQARSSPELAPTGNATDPPAPRIVTYEFDPEGDDLSVPRTQIAAHAVKLADPVDPLLVVLAETYSPRADAYRTLRRKLAANPMLRAIGVTSANAGEGKTVFALNLALALRESVKNRVLVVEANLRTPAFGKLLGFPSPDCFLQQIQRHAEDPRAPWVVAEPLPKLHVLAIDPETPHEPALDQVTFSAAMDRLKQAGYDYVVVDSPPVLGGLDCNVIADCVDGMILTALPMKSLRRPMRKAVEQLDPAPILGVVVLEA